jgi:hypothetical protein
VPPSPGVCSASLVDFLLLIVNRTGDACSSAWDVRLPSNLSSLFCRQDMTQSPPTQELVAKDLHGMEWRFRHIFRGKLCSSLRWDLLHLFH